MIKAVSIVGVLAMVSAAALSISFTFTDPSDTSVSTGANSLSIGLIWFGAGAAGFTGFFIAVRRVVARGHTFHGLVEASAISTP